MTTASFAPSAGFIAFARVSAIALSVGTFAFLFVNDHWRIDNAFLIPDLIVCALLLCAAAMPAPAVLPALLLAFAATAGVLGTAFSSLAVQGKLGIGALVAALIATVMAGLLLRYARPAPA